MLESAEATSQSQGCKLQSIKLRRGVGRARWRRDGAVKSWGAANRRCKGTRCTVGLAGFRSRPPLIKTLRVVRVSGRDTLSQLTKDMSCNTLCEDTSISHSLHILPLEYSGTRLDFISLALCRCRCAWLNRRDIKQTRLIRFERR